MMKRTVLFVVALVALTLGTAAAQTQRPVTAPGELIDHKDPVWIAMGVDFNKLNSGDTVGGLTFIHNGQGWTVSTAPTPAAPAPAPNAVSQDIVTGLDFPRSGATYRSITSLSGWALDCRLGTFPPVIRIVETKPDGSLREVPNTNFYSAALERPDVQQAYGGACPAVYDTPAADGRGQGPNTRFGWSLPVAAITEPGVHTFTITFAWPSQSHAGATAVSITIQ